MNHFDKKYLKISLYVILTVAIIRIIDSVITHVPAGISALMNALSYLINLTLPIIVAICIAYVLSGPVNGLTELFHKKLHIKRYGVARSLSLIITYAITLGIIFGIAVGIYYMIGGQLSKNISVSAIYSYVTNYLSTGHADTDKLVAQIKHLNLPFLDNVSGNLANMVGYLQSILNAIVKGIMQGIISLGSNILNIVIAFILSIYLLYSSDYFIGICNKLFYMVFRKSRIGNSIRQCLYVFHYTFSNYIRGQLIEAFCVAVLISVVLLFLNVDYAVVIGIITGVLNLIPYIGAFIGVLLATVMGLLSGGYWLALWAFIGTEAVQQLDANVLCPRIVGNKVGVHSAFILISITIGGAAWGFLGMLLAVPVTASLITLVRLWYHKHLRADFSSYHPYGKAELEQMLDDMENGTLNAADTSSTNQGSAQTKTRALVNDIKEILKEDNSSEEEKKADSSEKEKAEDSEKH